MMKNNKRVDSCDKEKCRLDYKKNIIVTKPLSILPRSRKYSKSKINTYNVEIYVK